MDSLPLSSGYTVLWHLPPLEADVKSLDEM